MEKMLAEKNIIEIIYNAEENNIDNIIKQANKKIKEEIKDIEIEKLLKDNENSKELKEVLEKIEDNYNIRITQYNKNMYKKGFIDGVNLMINCLKNDEF